MRKTRPTPAFGLGSQRANEAVFSRNHFASATPIPLSIQSQIDEFMMRRVAGNVYECPSTKDFWQVQGTKIVRLVVDEVDNGEAIPAAPKDEPMEFLGSILDDLTF
jgi:hypothetical protein